jgi:hypothetical protein
MRVYRVHSVRRVWPLEDGAGPGTGSPGRGSRGTCQGQMRASPNTSPLVAPTFHHQSWESPGICASRLNDPVPGSFWEPFLLCRPASPWSVCLLPFYFNELGIRN